MSNSKDFGTLNLIGCYLVDGDLVQAKTQEVSKITHFVDSLEAPVQVTIDVTRRHRLITGKDASQPVTIGVPTRKGTVYAYRQGGYYIEVRMKKMVASLTYTKEVTK